MEKWIQNVELIGKKIKLERLSLDHIAGLTNAVNDGKLWNLWYTSAPEPENVKAYINKALDELANGQSFPFAVIKIEDNTIVGTTRYMNIDSTNKRLEIGTTWYSKSSQRTGINTECKYLLLEYAFEKLDCIAVEFRTHWHNEQSRKAIQGLGAKEDGVLRNHRFDRLGFIRDTVVFSILNSEWKAVKQSLTFKMNEKYKNL